MSNWLIIVMAAVAVLAIAAVAFALWQPKAAARLAHDAAAALAQAVAADPALHEHVNAIVAIVYAAIPPRYRLFLSVGDMQALTWAAVQAAEAAGAPVIPPVIPPAA